MSVSHKKSFNFKRIYNPKRLSLSTRIEIMRKKRLVRIAKKLLSEGMHTPRPDTYDNNDDCVVNLKDLSFLLKGDCDYESDGSSLYDSDDFETETDETNDETRDETNDETKDETKHTAASENNEEANDENKTFLLVDEEAEIIEADET